MIPDIEQLLQVLRAAQRLLDARESQTVTAVEWDDLSEAVAECDSESDDEEDE